MCQKDPEFEYIDSVDKVDLVSHEVPETCILYLFSSSSIREFTRARRHSEVKTSIRVTGLELVYEVGLIFSPTFYVPSFIYKPLERRRPPT